METEAAIEYFVVSFNYEGLHLTLDLGKER